MLGEYPEPSDDARTFTQGPHRLRMSHTAAEQNIEFLVLAEWGITWTEVKNVCKKKNLRCPIIIFFLKDKILSTTVISMFEFKDVPSKIKACLISLPLYLLKKIKINTKTRGIKI